MLQQTTSKAVTPYYEAFVERFPTVHSLAEASLDDVLARWSGLGYYSRARHLKQAAEKIVAEHSGNLPDDVERLRALPGIGEYTAGAVLSIAFGKKEPVLDGNVGRVLTRLLTLAGDVRKNPLKRLLWGLARALVPEEGAGDFNQAMMELGATICTPTTPTCAQCPVAVWCMALRQGEVEKYPTPTARPATEWVRQAVALIERGQAYFMVRRRQGRLLTDIWEFPGVEIPLEGDPIPPLTAGLKDRLRLHVKVEGEPATIHHSVMNHRIRLLVYKARLAGGAPEGTDVAWIRPSEIGQYGVGGSALKILSLVKKKRQR